MKTDLEKNYYKNEWGKPLYDDNKLFEALILETFQSGLSWKTILNKRENFRKAFDNFDPEKIKDYDDEKVKSLLDNDGIIRHKGKIKGTIENAKKFLEIQNEFGSFSKYIWDFSDNKPIVNYYESEEFFPTTSSFSKKVSNDMKKRGFKYIGDTTIYSYLQAIGIIQDKIKI